MEDLKNWAIQNHLKLHVVGWGVLGVLAYKNWNKSQNWKIALGVLTVANAYGTYKALQNKGIVQ
jgi:hypothetical protein